MIFEPNAVFTARCLLVIFDGRPSADLEDSLFSVRAVLNAR